MRALIVRLSAMGDIVCGLPAASSMATAGYEVTWVVDRRFLPIVERCGSVHQTVSLERKDSDWKQKVQDLGAFDYALDLQGLWKSARIVGAAAAREKLGYHRQREFAGWFATGVRPDPTSLHVVDQYVDVARAAGGLTTSDFAFGPTDRDTETAARLTAKAGKEYAVINAGGAWASKRWQPEHFAQVSDALAGAGVASVYVGTKEEAGVFAQIRDISLAQVSSLHGQTDLGTLVGVIAGSRLHIGGDTGTSHIAAALGVPCVGLYNATRPERSCPYGQIDNCRSLDPVAVAKLAVSIAAS